VPLAAPPKRSEVCKQGSFLITALARNVDKVEFKRRAVFYIPKPLIRVAAATDLDVPGCALDDIEVSALLNHRSFSFAPGVPLLAGVRVPCPN
jgi:hypothetical protein